MRGMPSFARDLRTAPNLITLSRIALILTAAPLFISGHNGPGMGLSILAGLTDYADGMVARRTGQVTRLGEILDQFGDLVYESLLMLIAVQRGFFPAVVLYLYLFREFWIMCIRRYVAGVGGNIPSTIIGKLKSNFISWGFLPSFLHMSGWLPQLEPYLGWLGALGAALGIAASYISGYSYTRGFIAVYDKHVAVAPQTARTG
jgi:CDP-diacylglycerol--glycerol-3-phosphate 3-phosphatidyltransferase